MSAMPQPGGERWCYRDRKRQGGKLPAFLQGLSAPPGAAGRGPPARTTRRRVAWATVASSHHSRYAGAASDAPPCGSAGQQPAWGQFSPLLGARWINLRSRWVNPKPPLLHLHLYFKWPMGEKHFKITFEVKVLGKAQRSQSRFLTKAGWPCLCPHPRGQCCLPFQSPGGPQNPLLFLQEADRIKLLHKHLIYT